jgi:hypothetical protein
MPMSVKHFGLRGIVYFVHEPISTHTRACLAASTLQCVAQRIRFTCRLLNLGRNAINSLCQFFIGSTALIRRKKIVMSIQT